MMMVIYYEDCLKRKANYGNIHMMGKNGHIQIRQQVLQIKLVAMAYQMVNALM